VRFLVATLFAVALGIVVVLAPVVYALVVPAVLSIGVLALVLRWTATNHPLDRDVARWTYASYALHLALGLGIAASDKAVTFLAPDANNYHLDAIALSRHWSEGTPKPALPIGKEGFYLALARLYELIGPHRVGGLVIITLCSALLVPLVSDTTRRLFGRGAARAVLPLIVLLPGFLVWTSQLLREAPIVLGLALAINLAIRISEKVNLANLVLLAVTVAVLFTLRANVAYVFAAGLVVGLAMGGRHLVFGILTAGAMAGVLAAIVLGGGLGEGGYERSATADLKQVNNIRSALATTANSGVASDADVSTTSGSLAYLPIGVPQLLLGPFPWQVRNLRQLFGLLEAMTIWWFVPAFVRGVGRAGRRIGRRVALLLAPAAGITAVVALLIGNNGTLVRERLQVLVLLLPFTALGLVRRVGNDGRQASALTVIGDSAPEVDGRRRVQAAVATRWGESRSWAVRHWWRRRGMVLRFVSI